MLIAFRFILQINIHSKMNYNKEVKHEIISKPVLIPLNKQTINISAGPTHSYAITSDSVYLWGKKNLYANSKNENSIDSAIQASTIIKIPIKVKNITTGSGHTFAWNDKQVYCWGSNEYYELGLQEEKNYSCQKVELFQQALERGYILKDISCGQHHTLAVFNFNDKEYPQLQIQTLQAEQDTNELEIYQQQQKQHSQNQKIQLFAWGQSQSYQLTINTTNIIPYPVKSPCVFKNLDRIYSKSDFNIAVCSGQVYSWGCNLFSRLGITQTENQTITHSSQLPKVRIPKRVALPSKIITIGIGTYHVVAVAQNGEAYSWGKGNQGQLGIDKFETESRPTKIICNQIIVDASCGDSHTLVQLKDGRLKSCGSNSNGCLGHSMHAANDKKKRCKQLQYVQEVEKIGKIAKIACGSNHNLVLNKQGAVFGWGNNDCSQVLFLSRQSQNMVFAQHKNSRFIKKQLEIIVDDQNVNKQEKNIKRQGNLEGFIQKLSNWKAKYQIFKQQKSRQQQLLMKQFQEIMMLYNNKS